MPGLTVAEGNSFLDNLIALIENSMSIDEERVTAGAALFPAIEDISKAS